MAETTRRDDDDTFDPQEDESSGTERERVRSSNDRDQTLEREGIEHGDLDSDDIDPDSAEADIDRDDFVTD